MKKANLFGALALMLGLALLPQQAKAQEFQLPKNVVKMSGGLSLITSTVYHEDYSSNKIRKSSWRPGVTGSLEYEHIFGSGWGFGLNMIYNDTRYPSGRSNSRTKSSEALRQVYLGPNVVQRKLHGKRWLSDAAIGLGYGDLGGDLGDRSGLGIMLKLGVDYMLSQHVGIGVEWNELMVLTRKTADEKAFEKAYPDEYRGFSGVYRWDFAAGLRFYF